MLASNVHTNHALDPSMAEVTFPASPGSLGRYARALSLVETAEPTPAGIDAILADHGGQPQSICVHPEPDEGDEGSTILFAMIAEPVRRSLTIAAGHACTGAFETFRLDDLR
ncbi:MAG: hypothetical protein ACXVQJ_11520 [Actinomycetota bacterium]